MDYKEKLKSDFSDFDNLLNNPNHVVRRYYTAYLDGAYGEEIYTKWFDRYKKAKSYKQLRAFVIQSFCEFNALDYDCSFQQVQRWLMQNIGIEKLERLNMTLIDDVADVYLSVFQISNIQPRATDNDIEKYIELKGE
tara:strand:- start:177 stop:587 length:411 start_codon:yes stop_codon:yes gene_type:complete